MTTKLRKLFKHQKNALFWARGRLAIALFLEMRLGKSAVAIRWARINRRRGGCVLVVAPLSAIQGWMDELKLENETFMWIRTSNDGLASQDSDSRYYLIGYERLRVNPEILDSFSDCDAIILDESTRIKNPRARITQILRQRTRHFGYRAILSGLPAPESSMDFYEQINFLRRGQGWMACRNFWSWRRAYFEQVGFGWISRPGAKALVSRELRQRAFSLTRREANVGPRKLREKRVIEPSAVQLRAYKKVAREFAFEGMETKYMITKVLWLARIAGGHNPETFGLRWPSKHTELQKLLENELSKEPVVVWFRFNAELKKAFSRLRKAGIY
jgi:hypothetical protein